MNWNDHINYLELHPPEPFSFEECMAFLNRSDKEILHRCEGDHLFKLIKIDGQTILMKIMYINKVIRVEFPMGETSKFIREKTVEYIWEWFDLQRDLVPFYQLSESDKVLKPLVENFYGLRIIGIPDFFEALAWAILGQQILLSFAYTLKERLVKTYGESVEWGGETYWLFPDASEIGNLNVDELKKLQLTTRKAEYLIGVAQAVSTGALTKDQLGSLTEDMQIKSALMALRGVGAWTADYVMMKALGRPSAFPVGDAGLQNALKQQLGLGRKPTLNEMNELAKNWSGWEGYATFYLWRSLYEPIV